MATQVFKIVDKTNTPVSGATVSSVCNGVLLSEGNTNGSGLRTVTIQQNANNLIYVRYQAYTPVEYVYIGLGSTTAIEIQINTCISLLAAKQDYGSFLQWNTVSYPIRSQIEPLNICIVPSQTSKGPLCDRYIPEYETESYLLPLKKGDTVRWIMHLNEIVYEQDYSLLKTGITQDGVLVAEDCGTVTLNDDQLFCEALVPCLPDCDNYEFVIYRTDLPITANLDITQPTDDADCTGIIEVIDVDGGVSPYQYSIDNGDTWQSSPIFSDLCVGTYNIIIKDSDYSQKTLTGIIIKELFCGMFQGYTLQQVIDTGFTLGEIINAGCTLCDFVPLGDVQYDTENIVSNGDFALGGSGWLHPDGSPTFTSGYAYLNSSTQYIYQTVPTISAGDGIRFKADVFDVIGSYRIETNNGVYIYTGSIDESIDVTIPVYGLNDSHMNLIIQPLGGTQMKITNIELYRIINC